WTATWQIDERHPQNPKDPTAPKTGFRPHFRFPLQKTYRINIPLAIHIARHRMFTRLVTRLAIFRRFHVSFQGS
ncbi:MAG: hypothetical protein ACUVSA_13505, partial [Desulfosoma sp.]